MPETTEPELLDDKNVDITEKDIKEALKEPSNFAYFKSRGEEKMFDTWALGPVIRTRDSECIQQSNARVLIKKLESDPTLKDDWRITGCSHWACGWVDHLSFRAVEDVDPEIVKQIEVLDRLIETLESTSSSDDRAMETIVLESQSTVWNELHSLVTQVRERREALAETPRKPTRIFRFIKGWFDGLRDYGIADDADCSELAEELSLKHLPYICRNLLIDNPPEDWASQLYTALIEDGNNSTIEELYPSEEEVRPLLKELGLLKADEEEDAPEPD